jgi:hypothetical protein
MDIAGGFRSSSAHLEQNRSARKARRRSTLCTTLRSFLAMNSTNTSSLVLVHGIGGHWKESWGYKDFSWVKEFLQPDLEKTDGIVEIWSYGYESRTKTNSVANVDDVARGLLDRLYNHATKGPIIFVAHSLGGLVVKQVGFSTQRSALLISSNTSSYFLFWLIAVACQGIVILIC